MGRFPLQELLDQLRPPRLILGLDRLAQHRLPYGGELRQPR
jgi:hypothetical protein